MSMTSTPVPTDPPAAITSHVDVLGPWDGPVLPPEGETPYFAAALPIVQAHGGPLSRAFLDRLPAAWHGELVVVDSILVWLQAGQSLPSRWFHHEVYPGEARFAYGTANQERGVEHIACGFGVPSHREFVVGGITPGPCELLATAPNDFGLRHDHLRGLRDSGALRALMVPTGTMHGYGFGSFQRSIATREPGFHFWIRATRGSHRPLVNGRRNVTGPSVTGPWGGVFTP